MFRQIKEKALHLIFPLNGPGWLFYSDYILE